MLVIDITCIEQLERAKNLFSNDCNGQVGDNESTAAGARASTLIGHRRFPHFGLHFGLL
jgi:hypothetical protein